MVWATSGSSSTSITRWRLVALSVGPASGTSSAMRAGGSTLAGGTEFDVIVSDVMMPNMTGIELLEELRRIAPAQAARLIFLSGGAFTAQARDQLAELGVLQLEKPVTAKELRASISRIASGTTPPP